MNKGQNLIYHCFCIIYCEDKNVVYYQVPTLLLFSFSPPLKAGYETFQFTQTSLGEVTSIVPSSLLSSLIHFYLVGVPRTEKRNLTRFWKLCLRSS